jgi:hypothetical protein
MKRHERSTLVAALQESRTKPDQWIRVSGSYRYSAATSLTSMVRSVHRRGVNDLRGLVIEKGETWHARVVVPPGNPLDHCTLWVMYLGRTEQSD